MQKVQLLLINNEVLEFNITNPEFKTKFQDCYDYNHLISIKDEDNNTVFINPNHILYAKFKNI